VRNKKAHDAGKKVSDIKRHIAVDILGLPHAIELTTAEVTDRAGALKAIARCSVNLKQVNSVLVDGAIQAKLLQSPFTTSLGQRCKWLSVTNCISLR